MATTFKTFMNNDIATTRTLLHEAIPMTGTIVSGTYADENIKNYSHGMFQSVYDYPYLSSSANHIFDITVGVATGSVFSTGSWVTNAATGSEQQGVKKRNIYDQMAQVLVPYDLTGGIRPFDQNGNLNEGEGWTEGKFNEAIFVNFSRLLTKDEIKKGTFSITFLTGGHYNSAAHVNPTGALVLADHGAANSFKVNSPTGEYGLLFASSGDSSHPSRSLGHIYYQAGIAVITCSIFSKDPLNDGIARDANHYCSFGHIAGTTFDTSSYKTVLTGGTIENFADGVRDRIYDVSFNNTTELNSTIYFTRANTGDFNYSSNPTYISSSKITVKGDNPFAPPVSYITTIGLYSPNNELLAVAKLSEPLKKTPSNELTLRVRLDY